MGRKKNKKQPPKKDLKPRKVKVSVLTTESITYVDYKDINLLRRFMSERAKIRGRRVTGNNARQQRQVARAIRVAREMALLPYQVRQVTQRGGKRRRDRDSRDEGTLPTPSAPPPPPTGSPDSASAPVDEALSDAAAAPVESSTADAPEAGATVSSVPSSVPSSEPSVEPSPEPKPADESADVPQDAAADVVDATDSPNTEGQES